MTSISKEDSLRFLRQTVDLAANSPPQSTNFRVGCVIVAFDGQKPPRILSTGYTLELSGNTHAEQCALTKLAHNSSVVESDVGVCLPASLNTVLYTSLEPCGKRLSGNIPCVQRIIGTRKNSPAGGIRRVIFGAKEPGTFVQDSQSCRLLTEAGVEWEYLPDLENEILKVAMEGHVAASASNDSGSVTQSLQTSETPRVVQGDTALQLQQRTENQPRNPKKRMLEEPPSGSTSRD